MEFRTLGPLEVVAGGQALALGGAQQRAVLALLLARAPEAVSLDRLTDELWGERPPASAQHALQVYVSGIRKVLRAGGGGVGGAQLSVWVRAGGRRRAGRREAV